MLNDWSLGGYLMWRYPQLDLVMHGYGDTFTTAELTRNNDLLLVAPGWEDDVRALGRAGRRAPALVRAGDPARRSEGGGSSTSSEDLEMLEAPGDWRSPASAVAEFGLSRLKPPPSG